RMMAPTERTGCVAAWSQVILFSVSAVVILAERTALIFSLVHYLLMGQMWWAGLTLGLTLPGAGVQVLSFLWYRADGARGWPLLLVHFLQLGLYRRYWDCILCLCRAQGTVGELGAVVMQQADVSALRLLEALLLSLPQALLQTYLLMTTDVGLLSPVALCCALCLLSLSWALVLYSRACCLIRPGHLTMPPAALLCQLLWRVGMLGARISSLMFFARVFHWWVYGVAGFHWLVASFWLVSQQTDICSSTWHWRLFNCILGAVHVFFFLNVKDGPSRFRVAGFYVVMLLENATLLLSASDFLSAASWDNTGVSTAVLCSFLMGLTSLVLYYRFLHPKSTEISQSLRHGQMGSACWEKGESSFSLGDKTVAASSVHALGSCCRTGAAGSLVGHAGTCGAEPGGQCRHHHWLLVRLALKTGDLAKINHSYGAGGTAAILDAEEFIPETKDGPSSPVSDWEHAVIPFSEFPREESQSAADPAFPKDHEEGGKMEMGTPLGSQESEFRRGSPEGKSVLDDSPEPNVCPTESSSTLYFSADPQSPSSASNPGLEKEVPGLGVDNLGELSPISSDTGPHQEPKGMLGRVEPRFTSTPKLESGAQEFTGARAGVARRQLVPSRKDEAGHL
uniref:XK-related protein n=2 Tax=Lepisosteus oculatus TaxID=7918 RepID=W5LXT1_LEPOC